jgi:hypothetical protein
MAGTRYRDLEVSVSFRTGKCTQTHRFSVNAQRLPQSLGVEGLIVSVNKANSQEASPPEPAEPRPINPDRIAGRGAMRKRKVEITLPDVMTADKPTWKKYNVFPVPREVRTFFPPYKENFVIRSPRGEFVVAIASAHNSETDPYRGGYISRGAMALFKAHSDLQSGDVVVFKKDGKKEVDGQKLDVYVMSVKSS